MPSPFDYASEPVPSAPGVSVDDVIRSYLNLNKTLPQQQEDEIIIALKLSPLIDLLNTFTSTEVVTTTDDFDDNVSEQVGYRKVIPETVHSDPLIYDFSNSTGLTFNQPDTGVGTKFLAAAVADNSSYIVIADHPDLDITDEIIIPVWFYPKLSSGNSRLIHKGGSAYHLRLTNTNTFIFKVRIGGVDIELTHTLTSEKWHHIVATAKSGTQSLYVDNVLVDSDTQVGAINDNNQDLGIFANNNGGGTMADGAALSWLSIIHGFADASWVAEDFIGTRDVSTMDEIVCFPFMNDARAQTLMTSGLFVSNT